MLVKFKIFNILGFLFCLVILSSLSFSGVFAMSQFNENFSNLNNWETISNGSTDTWIIEENNLIGSVSRQGNSFLLLENINFGKFFDLNYQAKNMYGIDQELLFRINKDSSEFYVINTRFYEPKWSQDSANEVVIWKCSSFAKNVCSEVYRNKNLGFFLNKNQFYKFELIVNNNNVNFYIDNRKVIEYVFPDDYTGGIGFWSWGGDYSGGVRNYYKGFSITSYDSEVPTPVLTITPTGTPIPTDTPIPTETPTPIETPIPTDTPMPTETPIPTETPAETPTPTPVERKKKIFILPGLGASWNSKAIVYNQSVGDSDWKMTPFVNNYDGLIELMNLNGLEKDKDYFVWNYDWRKSIANIKTDFDEYIKSKNLSDSDDVYLIGHSLGGVVARLWAQDNNNENIKKVIALGSPNLGSLDAYSVWNGGKVLRNDGISDVAFQIILGLQNKGFVLTDLNKIRNYTPVVKDLLPIFDYATKNKKSISWSSMESRNDFLKNQNNNLSSISNKLKLSVGIGFSTPVILNLGSRSVVSKSLGLWPDGEIKNYSTSIGDGTVLKKSSSLDLSDIWAINSKHGEIPTRSINNVADEIGLENKNITFSYVDNFSNSFIVFIGSPVTSTLKCENEIYQEENGFIVVKNKNYSECELNLSPTDNGTVHVVLGNTTTNEWNYFEDEVSLNNSEKIKIDYKKTEIKIDVSNKQILKDQIKNDLEKLGLNKAIKFLDKNDLGKVAWYVFEYRSKNDERIISQRILDNLFVLGSIISPNKIRGNYKWLDIYVGLMERTLEIKSKKKNISQKSAASLVQLQSLEKEINQMIRDKKYPDYSLVIVLSTGYGNESLRD